MAHSQKTGKGDQPRNCSQRFFKTANKIVFKSVKKTKKQKTLNEKIANLSRVIIFRELDGNFRSGNYRICVVGGGERYPPPPPRRALT